MYYVEKRTMACGEWLVIRLSYPADCWRWLRHAVC